MEFTAYIFDLDGTLLDTLSDLVVLTNRVLEKHGMPQRSREEILGFVGNGGKVLLSRAAPEGTSEGDVDRLFAEWQTLYPTLGHAQTKPYPGIPEKLAQLKGDGMKLGVLSNKFDAAAKEVIAKHFPGVFDIVRGESPETPRKPDPTGLLRMIGELGATPQTTAYVGDSGTDMQTACAAGAYPVGVTWGYQSTDVLRAAGARTLWQ